MKLTHLLAQFLYKNRRLDLQGIGSFLLDNTIIIETEKGKHSAEINIEGITFENNQTLKEDPELIAFISNYTGKIKALAAADLNSHLELAKQFLNIGKPFLFEGIGSLTKNMTGEFNFIPGTALTEKLGEEKKKQTNTESSTEEPVSDFKSALYKKDIKSKWKKPVIFLFIVAGIGMAIWGGYTVYKNTSSKKINREEPQQIAKESTILLEDTMVAKIDTLKIEPPVKTQDLNGATKFVLEIGDKEKTLQRYNQLRNFLWDVKMETKDSINYKLFLLIPANAMDTSRIIDSLTLLSGKKVYVEK